MVTISAPRCRHSSRYASWDILSTKTLKYPIANYLLYFYGLYHIWIIDQEKEAERVENAQDPVVSKPALTTGGSLVGFISSFIGIAGGTITIPLLSHWGFNTRKCIATSSMLGVIIATIGTVMGIVYGWQQTELADYYLGFVYLPAFIGISITSILTAPIGVKVAYKLPIARVRQIFALFLLIVMAKMLYTLILG